MSTPTINNQWMSQGYFHDETLLTSSAVASLYAEAEAQERASYPIKSDETVVRRDGGFAAPCDFLGSRGGPQLIGLMRSPDLLQYAREATGMPRLIPSRCAYNYYYKGSFIGLHRDAVRSTVTFTVALTDNLGEMGLLPDERGVPNERLATIAGTSGFFPANGTMINVDYGVANCFDGYEIPHWRLPFEFERGILATVSFFDL